MLGKFTAYPDLWKRLLIPAVVMLVVASRRAEGPANGPFYPEDVPPLPAASDWTDYGLVIDVAPFGQGWDALFEGATPAALLKHDGTYYLYYIGADDYIAQLNNLGPANRSIGVATSTDAVNWTKHPGNPIVTFSSSGNPEEGAVSAGVHVDSDGLFHMFYGANIARRPTSSAVNANVRYATSLNGLDFTDLGTVLRYTDIGVWGRGDELHATMAWKQGSLWYAYYVPNGVPVGGKLGVAWGPSPETLSRSSAVMADGSLIDGGPGSIVQIDADTLAFFITRNGVTQARVAPVTDPIAVSAPLQTYDLKGFGKAVYLDADKRTWFMVYDHWSYMGLMLAPHGSPDTSPPTPPGGLSAVFRDHQTAILSWQAADDPDTGIVQYDVYRDGIHIGSTKTLSFEDSGLAELTPYAYEVRAVNYHGTGGPGADLMVTTPADVAPPRLLRVQAAQDPYQLQLTFDEPVDRLSAEDPSRYTLNDGLVVSSAFVGDDDRTVILSTAWPQIDNAYYELTAAGIADTAQSPNQASVNQGYTFSALPALAAYYRFEMNAVDTSGANNHGILYEDPPWSAGVVGGALTLSGSQYIEIDNTPGLDDVFSGDHTLTAWVRPAGIPPRTTNSNGAYTVLSGPTVRLDYDHAGRFVARLETAEGTVRLRSRPLNFGAWYHLAVSVNSLEKQFQVYVNGVPVRRTPAAYAGELKPLPAPAVGVMDEYNSRYRIGVNQPLFDWEKNFFVGDLDEIRIYSRALTSEEVAAVYAVSASD
jgi:hypothetical protein